MADSRYFFAMAAICGLGVLSQVALAQTQLSEDPILPTYIQSLRVISQGGDEPIASSERALFSYADSARVIADGAIWAWGSEGRPLAIAKCWKNRNGTQTCAFSLTSDTLLVARGPEGKVWEPKEVQVEVAELKGAPVPSLKDSLRLLQIKEQARRFQAHEFWGEANSRFELRLLTQPVRRYRDDKLNVVDGAVFLLAYDNNPQVVLLIEIVRPKEGEAHWQYLLARVSSADLHVALDGTEVWARERTPGVVGKSTDYYWHMVTNPDAR
jgi:hypothetical protein